MNFAETHTLKLLRLCVRPLYALLMRSRFDGDQAILLDLERPIIYEVIELGLDK